MTSGTRRRNCRQACMVVSHWPGPIGSRIIHEEAWMPAEYSPTETFRCLACHEPHFTAEFGSATLIPPRGCLRVVDPMLDGPEAS